MISFFQIKLFNKIGSLTSIETSDNIQSFVFKCQSSMEISSCIKVCYLIPLISTNVINFTFVHALWRQTWSDCIYMTFLFLHKDTSECMSSSLKKHVSPLDKSFFNKLIATFCSFSWFTTSSEEDTTFFIFNRHEICWNFNVDNIRSIWVASEIIHKQIVCVIHEKVQCIKHLFVVSY